MIDLHAIKLIELKELAKSKNIEVKLAKHPSYRAKNGRKPEVYVETFDYL